VAPHQQENTHCSMERGMKTINWVQILSGRNKIMSAVKWIRSVSESMLYIKLRGG
jgi:hypothetical protein